MDQKHLDAILKNPKFKHLVRRRTIYAWSLSIVMLVAYLSFILVIAFSPTLLGVPLDEGLHSTVGIPVGIGIILLAFLLTGLYVHKSNGEFDRLTAEILKELE